MFVREWVELAQLWEMLQIARSPHTRKARASGVGAGAWTEQRKETKCSDYERLCTFELLFEQPRYQATVSPG